MIKRSNHVLVCCLILSGLFLHGYCLESFQAPLKTLRWIYETNDPAKLYAFFNQQVEFLKTKNLYTQMLEEVYSHNDGIKMTDLVNKREFTEAERIQWVIRYVNRSVLRMGELEDTGLILESMGKNMSVLDTDWRSRYFYDKLYSAIAKQSPDALASIASRRFGSLQNQLSQMGLLFRCEP